MGTAIAYLLYMKKIVDTFGEMLNASQQVARVSGAASKIAQLLARESKVAWPKNGVKEESGNFQGEIEFANVKFHYPTKPDVQVLDGVDIAIPAN